MPPKAGKKHLYEEDPDDPAHSDDYKKRIKASIVSHCQNIKMPVADYMANRKRDKEAVQNAADNLNAISAIHAKDKEADESAKEQLRRDAGAANALNNQLNGNNGNNVNNDNEESSDYDSENSDNENRRWNPKKQSMVSTKLNHRLMNPIEMFKISQSRKLINDCKKYKIPSGVEQYKNYKKSLQ
jgi:hypothetical protein